MIEIYIVKRKAERSILLEATGHAAPEGNSEICAAVSSLVYGYAKVVADTEKRYFKQATVDVRPGRGTVYTVSDDDKRYKLMLAALSPVEAALTQLAEKHPEAIQVRIK
ncbi:MAG: ribosomal-processing cysteine protease Prp [Clostridia bacterium]|nr:ribosomal-processing cysteine protease Prp [Clostridia bacterium]